MEPLLLALQLGAGVFATASDLRTGKIYNRDLLLFGLLGALVYGLAALTVRPGPAIDWPELLTNALCTVGVAFLLFYARFWSPGDAKLFCLMALLMPVSLYPAGLLFPGFDLLAVVFGLGFGYAVVESLYQHARDARRPPAERRVVGGRAMGAAAWRAWLLRYLAATLWLGLLYRVLGRLDEELVSRDRGLLMVGGLILLVLVYSRLQRPRVLLAVIAAGVPVNVLYLLLSGGPWLSWADVYSPLVALIAIGVMQLLTRYDYLRIPVAELKPGMILALATIAGFRGSRREGLPRGTTETTASRLTAAEVEGIRAWSAAKASNSHVVIVVHVPFAPFILAGTVLYVALAYAGLRL